MALLVDAKASVRRRLHAIAPGLQGVFVVLMLVLITASSAFADERRIALVIGNSKYALGGNLKNPVHDAADVQVALQRLGFEVHAGLDLDFEAFRQSVDNFTKAIKNASIALLFYAGHGVQYDQQNYLLPTDIELKSASDLAGRSIALNKVLEDMGRSATASVIFLDACRDNPLTRSLSRGPATGAGGRSAWEFVRGLATVTAEPADRFVVFAAAPGTVAEDGRGRNSPFTDALLRHIHTPDDDIGAIFSNVRRDVLRSTKNRQQPEALNALTRQLFLRQGAQRGEQPDGQAGLEPSSNAPSVALSEELEFWFAMRDTRDPKNFEDYLSQFPKGKFVILAQRRLEELQRSSDQVASKLPTKTSSIDVQPPRPGTQARAKADVAAGEGEFVEGAGIARISRDHPREEALRSARTLARARLIVAWQPALAASLPTTVVSSSEAAELLGNMARGLTYSETWTIHEASEREVKVELRAKVRSLATTDRKLSGSIEPTLLTSGQPLRLHIEAKRDAIIGIFAWQADGTVVRLYPDKSRKNVVIKAGEKTSFPRPDDAYPAIMSANLPGESHNHEALIVVTSDGLLPFSDLVPMTAADTAAQSLANSLDGAAFLSRIAALPDAGLEMLVLPYEVRARP